MTLDRVLALQLVLWSEDWFFDRIKNTIESRNESCLNLLSHVDLLCLSTRKMIEFLECIDYTMMSREIWCHICARLQSDGFHRHTQSSIHEYISQIQIQPRSNIFDGIFAWLKKETGGNCAINGTIIATASNTCCGTLSVLFDTSDYSGSSYWHHNNAKDGYFQIDFKDRRLAMTHYAIHNNSHYVRERDFLKTWTVEGANSDLKWTVIDSRPMMKHTRQRHDSSSFHL
jgi:hypothetical protein